MESVTVNVPLYTILTGCWVLSAHVENDPSFRCESPALPVPEIPAQSIHRHSGRPSRRAALVPLAGGSAFPAPGFGCGERASRKRGACPPAAPAEPASARAPAAKRARCWRQLRLRALACPEGRGQRAGRAVPRREGRRAGRARGRARPPPAPSFPRRAGPRSSRCAPQAGRGSPGARPRPRPVARRACAACGRGAPLGAGAAPPRRSRERPGFIPTCCAVLLMAALERGR